MEVSSGSPEKTREVLSQGFVPYSKRTTCSLRSRDWEGFIRRMTKNGNRQIVRPEKGIEQTKFPVSSRCITQESLAAFFGGRAGTASLRLQESLAAFLGDVQEQRPSDFRKALRLFGGTCRSNVPPRHGMRGTKTCISECGIGRMLTDKIVRFCFRCKKCVNYSTFIRAKKRIFAPEYGFCQLHFAKRTANNT